MVEKRIFCAIGNYSYICTPVSGTDSGAVRNVEKGGDLKVIIVPVREGENIEKALKKFKRKFEKTGAVRELRSRREFEKPSVKKRVAKMKAIYVNHLRLEEEGM